MMISDFVDHDKFELKHSLMEESFKYTDESHDIIGTSNSKRTSSNFTNLTTKSTKTT